MDYLYLEEKKSNGTIMNRVLLSICIPTFNRSALLNHNLNQILKQLYFINFANDIEIIISDNCSTDDTKEIVKYFLKIDNRFKYFRNDINIGADLNIVNCYNKSSGQYLWILADDDFIFDNKLILLFDKIKTLKYDYLFLNSTWYLKDYKKELNKDLSNKNFNSIEYDNPLFFLKKINYWITFLSSNIINKNILDQAFNLNKFVGTSLHQVHWYLSVIENSKNYLYITTPIIGCKGNNTSNYNVFGIFVTNLRKIILETLVDNNLRTNAIKFIDKKMMLQFLPQYIIPIKSYTQRLEVLKLLYINYGNSLLFWLFILPLLILPNLFSKNLLKVSNYLINE